MTRFWVLAALALVVTLALAAPASAQRSPQEQPWGAAPTCPDPGAPWYWSQYWYDGEEDPAGSSTFLLWFCTDEQSRVLDFGEEATGTCENGQQDSARFRLPPLEVVDRRFSYSGPVPLEVTDYRLDGQHSTKSVTGELTMSASLDGPPDREGIPSGIVTARMVYEIEYTIETGDSYSIHTCIADTGSRQYKINCLPLPSSGQMSCPGRDEGPGVDPKPPPCVDNAPARRIGAAQATHPQNDLFGDATTLEGLPTGRTGDTNAGASDEPGEPSHAGQRPSASVWYSWTAPATQPVTVSTAGSGFDTLLGVYTGGTPDSLSPVAANDDSPPGAGVSEVTFEAVAGTTYRIAVDGLENSTGTVAIEVRPGKSSGVSAPGAQSGTPGPDTLYGRGGEDIINGGAGDDCIFGRGAIDTINGQAGDDRLYGDADSDMIDGGDGKDRVGGGAGEDIVDGGKGSDTVDGGDGNDLVADRSGNNSLKAGAGNDTVISNGGGADKIDCGKGKDVAYISKNDKVKSCERRYVEPRPKKPKAIPQGKGRAPKGNEKPPTGPGRSKPQSIFKAATPSCKGFNRCDWGWTKFTPSNRWWLTSVKICGFSPTCTVYYTQTGTWLLAQNVTSLQPELLANQLCKRLNLILKHACSYFVTRGGAAFFQRYTRFMAFEIRGCVGHVYTRAFNKFVTARGLSPDEFCWTQQYGFRPYRIRGY